MSFSKLTPTPYPRRLWGLVGFPGSGKSTFAARMRTPMLAIDADHRFSEVLSIAGGDVYQLSDTPADNTNPERIAAALRANMPGADVRTVIVNSLTAIIAPLVTGAILDNDAGRQKNKMTSFKTKALAMRLLQDSIGAWGTDVLWIYHLQQGRDAQANEVTTTTISRTELARLTRSLNLGLCIVEDGARRGVKVEWARRGRSGITLWDESGSWQGMPERIEEAVYAGLSPAEQDELEQALPTRFAGPEQAIAWAVDFGAFDVLQHARNASAMWELWDAECAARKTAAGKTEEEQEA